MKPNAIRPIAICVFQHNGRILAAEGYDPVSYTHLTLPTSDLV